jgi:dTMP kinase
MQGRFVVVEGGDACGKSTQVALVVDRLRASGIDAVATFEPGATPAGAVIRELLLHRSEHVTPRAEALLMAADRAQHVADVVRPALERGQWIVSDRFTPSSLVYQGVVRGVGVSEVESLNRVAVGSVSPDLVLVLDVDDRTIASRTVEPGDRLEAEGAMFQAAVRDAYRVLARERGWTLVDGSGTVDAVAARVWHVVEPLRSGVFA